MDKTIDLLVSKIKDLQDQKDQSIRAGKVAILEAKLQELRPVLDSLLAEKWEQK